MFPSVFTPVSNMSFLYQRSGRFKLDICSSPNLYLEVCFNIQSNSSGNPNANLKTFSRFGCSYTVDLTARTCNVKKSINHYLLISWLFENNGNVKSVVNSNSSRFLKFAGRCCKVHVHTGLDVYTDSSGGSQFVAKSFSMC